MTPPSAAAGTSSTRRVLAAEKSEMTGAYRAAKMVKLEHTRAFVSVSHARRSGSERSTGGNVLVSHVW